MRLQIQPSPLWIGVEIVFYTFIAISIAEARLGILIPSILITYDRTPNTVTLLFISQISGYVLAALTSSLFSGCVGLGQMLFLAASLLHHGAADLCMEFGIAEPE